MNLVDETLPMTTFDFAQCFFMILGSILITVIVLPYALIILPVLLVIFVYIRMYYIATSRQVKRLESTTRSPVYSSFPSTIEGLALIRAFDAENRFLKSFFETQNENTRVFFSFLSCGRWLGFRLDILAFAFLLIVAPLCVVLRSQLGLSGGVIGLVLSYMLENLGLIQWAVRQSAEVENFMVSAERVMEYSNLPSEAAEVTATRPPAGWPSKGEISINNMTLKYPKGDEPVLKDISFSVKPGEKIGIVGRTGAGKSSLLQALFRIVEPTPQKSIVIDGLATSDLGLKDLRCNLSIIPQESFCFKGSLRFNLDPFKHSSDQEIWRALDAVELKRVVENLPFKLETPVEENGSNWSVGERQLICLARTVLRNSKVVVMDEATSNVDARTDACIQRAIRDDSMGIFANASVLTIAHRLNTVIDYDQILVLDAGRVVEFGPPWALLEKAPTDESAWFSRLVAEMDPEVQNALRRISTTRKKTN